MLKKKKCATKRGKWAMEYNVKVSVNPVKRKKKGSWGRSLSDAKYLISRKCPKTGYTEKVIYTGNIKLKPKGWKVEKKIEGYSF